jgi:hypothetical protein
MGYNQPMSLQEPEQAVSQLPADEFKAFARWFEERLADEWDRQIGADVAAGKLDHAAKLADSDFDAGRCTPRN